MTANRQQYQVESVKESNLEEIVQFLIDNFAQTEAILASLKIDDDKWVYLNLSLGIPVFQKRIFQNMFERANSDAPRSGSGQSSMLINVCHSWRHYSSNRRNRFGLQNFNLWQTNWSSMCLRIQRTTCPWCCRIFEICIQQVGCHVLSQWASPLQTGIYFHLFLNNLIYFFFPGFRRTCLREKRIVGSRNWYDIDESCVSRNRIIRIWI